MSPHEREHARSIRAVTITISTSRAQSGGEDLSGPALARFAERLGAELIATEVIGDDRTLIEGRLRYWADEGGCELILTSGGTGMAPSDVTPEATRAVLEREAPGIGEAMRAASREHTPHWMLSRALAGLRGRSLIVNFPGSPQSIDEIGQVLAPALPHALRLLVEAPTEH